ncbi:hypothetical protein Tco_1325202, partial [Tanacetum coccineum]
MEWLPKCEELEKVVGGHNWLDMMIVYFDEYTYEQREFACRVNRLIGEMNEACANRIAFVWELQSVTGETVPAKTAAFLEVMMNKEGTIVWQLAYVQREAKERVCEFEFFVGKLMHDARVDGDKGAIVKAYGYGVSSPDWEPQFILYCERAKSDDVRLARQINTLCDTLTDVIDRRWGFVGELDMLAYKFVLGKMVEFMKETQDKDILNLMKLQILGREFELRACEKDLFIQKLKVDCWSKKALFADFPCTILVLSLFFVASVIVLWLGGVVP